MILEDTTSIIDRHLGEMAFGRPFIDETGLVYDRKEGTVMFKHDDEKITFKMPHTMEIFKQTRLMGLSTDSIPSSAYEENFSHGRTHYYQSLLIGDEYMQDGGDRRGIRHLITGRKAHLLEDKQIPSVGVFDEVYLAFERHLEEIYVTWAHLEKKRMRLWTYINISQDYVLSDWRRRHQFYTTPSQPTS
ncbi:hypothetical protein Tco_0998434 [Tanacetum coccineum]